MHSKVFTKWKSSKKKLFNIKSWRRKIHTTICDFHCMILVIKLMLCVLVWDEQQKSPHSGWKIIHLELFHVCIAYSTNFQLIFCIKCHSLSPPSPDDLNAKFRVEFHPSSHQFNFKLKSTKLIQSSRVEISFHGIFIRVTSHTGKKSQIVCFCFNTFTKLKFICLFTSENLMEVEEF